MSDLILPIIHPNGSSQEELVDLRKNASRALLGALEALSAMAPNGRDYYPQPGLYERAVAQHEARVAAVRSVYEAVSEETTEVSFL